MPFLTELDTRAQVKGSRDPLGFVPVWSRFGRQVVGNLTTVSNSVRGFSTLLLGYYFAEAVHETHGRSVGTPLELFLKFEQLAAYCRMHASNHEDRDFRGVERVARRLEHGSTATLGASQEHQILSNQKIYGLWGLFTVPAKNSGLLRDDGRLEDEAREHVEQVLIPGLKAKGLGDPRKVISNILTCEEYTVRLDTRHQTLAKALAHVLRPKLSRVEVDFYRKYLVELAGVPHDPTNGRQRQLARLIVESSPDGFEMSALHACSNAAEKKGWDGLNADLRSIAALEPLLVAADQVFAQLCSSEGETIDSVASGFRSCWKSGLRFLNVDELENQRATIAAGYNDAGLADRLLQTARALKAGDYAAAANTLLAQNAEIMSSRHGSNPWACVERGRLKVNFMEEANAPSAQEDLPFAWRNTYFINSLERVCRTVEA